MKVPRVGGSFTGPLLIVAFFAALIFLPPLFKKFKYSFDPGPAPYSGPKSGEFPIDQVLPVLDVPGKPAALKSTSLRQLSAASNRTVLVNFWASWCPPCLEELPSLEFLNRQLKERQSADGHIPLLVTVSVDEKAEAVLQLYKTLDFQPTFLVLHDKDGSLARAVGTSKFPETFWVEPSGKILYKWVGPQEWLSGDILQRLRNIAQK